MAGHIFTQAFPKRKKIKYPDENLRILGNFSLLFPVKINRWLLVGI